MTPCDACAIPEPPLHFSMRDITPWLTYNNSFELVYTCDSDSTNIVKSVCQGDTGMWSPLTVVEPCIPPNPPLGVCERNLPWIRQDCHTVELTDESPCAFAASENYPNGYPNEAVITFFNFHSKVAMNLSVKYVETFEVGTAAVMQI